MYSKRAPSTSCGTAQIPMPAMGVPLETLGIELVHSHETGNFRISRLWPHGPAAASGQLGEGDTLLCVEGVSVSGLPMHIVQSILNGEHSGRGSVTVIAQRAGGGGVVVVSLTRRALDPEDGAAGKAGGQRADDIDSASTDSLYLLDGPMESNDFDDDRFSSRCDKSLAPSTSDSIRDNVLAKNSWEYRKAGCETCARAQHDDERHEHSEEGQESEDSFHADLLAQSVILAKCEQLQDALDEALHGKQQLEDRLSRLEDLNQEHAIRCLEAQDKIAELQEALDAGRTRNLQQREQITTLEHEVLILKLTLRRRKEEAEEEDKEEEAPTTRQSESTQNQLKEWISLYRSEAARREELEIKLQHLSQSHSADNERTEGSAAAQRGGGKGSEVDSRDAGMILGEEPDGYKDDGAQVLNSLIQLASTIVPCALGNSSLRASMRAKRESYMRKLDQFLDCHDPSTSVLAILSLGALGIGRAQEAQGKSDDIAEMVASHCPAAVNRATVLLKTGGHRSRRYSALLLSTLSQSSTGRDRIQQHSPCLPAIIKALADKDILAATYAVHTVWCLVTHGGTHIWRNRASFGPSQVAATLHAAAHRPGMDPAATEKALAALNLLQYL